MHLVSLAACLALTLSACSNGAPAQASAPAETSRTFASPEEAVRVLNDVVKKGSVEELLAIFGPEGKELLDSSDPAIAQRNRQVFTVAFAEAQKIVDEGGKKWLIVGHEAWPFPVPLVQDGNRWRFDTAAGKEEVLARRIGRNELAAIRVSRGYVAAQRRYASGAHDGKRAGLFAQAFRSDTGKHNGLFWIAAAGQPRSPIGDLLSEAAVERAAAVSVATRGPSPFYGYYFRILTAQGDAAPGGAQDYMVGNDLSRGFALIAWPSQYDVTGIMTFIVNQDGIVYQRDFGAETEMLVKNITRYDPDSSWSTVE